MERRKFVKRLSVFTTGSLVLSGSNMYASGVVANLQSQAANTMYSTPSPTLDFTNQISSGVTNPFNAMSSIRQKAGFGNIYGSLNSMASVGS